MAVTIREIARSLNISHSTVSRVLTNRADVAISHETRLRVLNASRELRYRPNLAARALATGRSGTIAIWSGTISGSFYCKLLQALELEVTSHDYRMQLRRTRNHQQDLQNVMQSSDVDGIIAVDAFPEVRGSLSVFPGLGIPCVFLGVYSPEFSDRVVVDMSGAVRQALALMLAQGRKRVAYMVNNEHAWMVSDEDVRYRVYTQMMAENDRTPEVITFPSFEYSRAREALVNHIRTNGSPDGLLCQNDAIAMSSFRALRDLGLRVPEDVALVGCDGTYETEFFDPPISTIAQPVEEMCSQAWQILQQRMADPTLPVLEVTLNATLMTRLSLGDDFKTTDTC